MAATEAGTLLSVQADVQTAQTTTGPPPEAATTFLRRSSEQTAGPSRVYTRLTVHFWLFLCLAAFALLLRLRSWYIHRRKGGVQREDSALQTFRQKFLAVYLAAVTSDWLQGPYMYQLYREYGFGKGAIGVLLVAGYFSAAISGVVVGSFADAFGRRLSCLVYCIAYGVSCLVKHSSRFAMLFVGRVLGGIATALLFSVFDAWLVTEHKRKGFDDKSLGETFQSANECSALSAVVSGLFAAIVVESGGAVSAFDLAFAFLVLTAVLLLALWEENYGRSPTAAKRRLSGLFEKSTSSLDDDTKRQKEKREGGDWAETGALLREGLRLMWTRSDVASCGVMQSCFEGAMYTFVFAWTPALPPSVNHGMMFACFMTASMLGGFAYEELRRLEFLPVTVLHLLFGSSSIALLLPALSGSPSIRTFAFLIFEVACGCYFCAFSVVRAGAVPDTARATVLTLLRVPVNILVVATCHVSAVWGEESVFAICSLLQFFALFASLRVRPLLTLSGEKGIEAKKKRDVSPVGPNAPPVSSLGRQPRTTKELLGEMLEVPVHHVQQPAVRKLSSGSELSN
uniref:Molybdate-anion transporter n=1 Tax=Chromera velia CCMP2878 TaxID=1169474 RepID=A0A0G4FHL3_9ALVE|eukprot:Cvel_17049.t1-p1 / transcript=Cvel_17049.t1 / gene=Cvel_17049 / organism=Chromera_velia_CCMP2878 / gene_product=Major facilitator superfamily domain-containing, putative / transcript_product=Major facilitator superfamily domain-containing, putative / location=Cvel_scaffold1342:33218-38642(+) / protein_length=568 / sequence_SO=supercontig / SO=protein_coding / is_pseudo=false